MATMCYLAEAQFPSPIGLTQTGILESLPMYLIFEGVLNTAFNQIRQFSEGNTAVTIRLVEALGLILRFIRKESHKKAVIRC